MPTPITSASPALSYWVTQHGASSVGNWGQTPISDVPAKSARPAGSDESLRPERRRGGEGAVNTMFSVANNDLLTLGIGRKDH